MIDRKQFVCITINSIGNNINCYQKFNQLPARGKEYHFVTIILGASDVAFIYKQHNLLVSIRIDTIVISYTVHIIVYCPDIDVCCGNLTIVL